MTESSKRALGASLEAQRKAGRKHNGGVSNALKYVGLVGAIFPFVFVGVVVYLHAVQPGYDFRHQFMSELALGPAGWLMLIAFLALAVSIAALGVGFVLTGAKWPVIVSLWIAAAGFTGAGFVPLDWSADIHIAFVALSFVTLALAMYLLPYCAASFSQLRHKAVSWLLAGGLAVGVALGSGPVPVGLGQRVAALFVILWSVWVGVRLSRPGRLSG